MRAFLAAVILILGGQVATQEALQPLLDFTNPKTSLKWQAVNDGVMGGVSDGQFRVTEEKTLEFFGTLSLENNGGFTSVRTQPVDGSRGSERATLNSR
jgi:monofunctional biosynthetic peptidoglycan transglycosylase